MFNIPAQGGLSINNIEYFGQTHTNGFIFNMFYLETCPHRGKIKKNRNTLFLGWFFFNFWKRIIEERSRKCSILPFQANPLLFCEKVQLFTDLTSSNQIRVVPRALCLAAAKPRGQTRRQHQHRPQLLQAPHEEFCI